MFFLVATGHLYVFFFLSKFNRFQQVLFDDVTSPIMTRLKHKKDEVKMLFSLLKK